MKAVIGSKSGPQVSFVGPFGVGKTTAVLTVCQSEISTTEVKRSSLRGAGRHIKPTTTVGLEIGEWTAADGTVVVVVGTPGQERFDAVRKSAMPRSKAVVLWLFGDHSYAHEDADLWLEFITSEVPKTKLVVAVTRLPEGESLDPYRDIVDKYDADIPLVAADPREADSVAVVLEAALERSRTKTPTK